ncbi:MAG: hypothetical protein NZ651_04180 [Candidatus Bipolaricaulota bacterium]|nr:hypothetical protein [Candidatus Bipolaricaulota bacterium]MDW8126948.1 hypothetical protein [Candidatus Bipolaricaulota bacterium]
MRRFVFFVGLALTLASTGFAEPVKVYVGIYVLNLGKFELATGAYTVDFYLSLRADAPVIMDEFEFMNGRAATVDKLIDTPTEKFFRIQANLSQNLDLRRYPFDKHVLTIEIEDKRRTAEELIYVVDEKACGVDPSVIVVGWRLAGWEAHVVTHAYEIYGETYSRFVFGLQIQRVTLNAVIKSFLPIACMLLVGFLSLLLTPDKVTTRLSLNISTLLGAVMFHVNLTSSIPPVGYLTLADRVMIVTYIILALILLSGVAILRWAEREEKKALVLRIYHQALGIIPGLSLVFYALVFLLPA